MAEKQKIGKYEIISELGRGGMGVVYKAWEESLQRFVAIKMLGDQLTHDEIVVARFLREARAVADLNHPNVVQVFAVDTHEGRPYFAMEYVEGESLTEVIRTSVHVDPRRAVQLIKETAAGLAAAHAKGVVHRDIKPDNIMLTKHGGVKVVDFGVAKVDDPDSKLTVTGMAVGTPNYISPEVCLGQEVDARSDLFSLGIVFYEMLAGETPFLADSPIAMMTAVVNSEVPDITTLNQKVDEPLRLILGQMLEKNVEARYQGCPELVEDLDSYAAGEPPAHALAAVNDRTMKMSIPDDLKGATTKISPIQSAKTADGGGMQKGAWAAALLLLFSAGAAGWYYFQETPQDTQVAKSLAEDTGGLELAEKSVDEADSQSRDQPAASGQSDLKPASEASVGGVDQSIPPAPREPDGESAQPIVQQEPEESVPAQIALNTSNTAVHIPEAVPQPVGPPKLVVIAVGDPAVSTVVESVLESALIAADFTVMDEQFFDGVGPGGFGLDLASVGRNAQANGADILVLANIRQAGERRLTFYGRTEIQFMASMRVRALRLADKRPVGAPWTDSLEYVALNAAEQARDAAEPIAEELVARLQALN